MIASSWRFVAELVAPLPLPDCSHRPPAHATRSPRLSLQLNGVTYIVVVVVLLSLTFLIDRAKAAQVVRVVATRVEAAAG